jgi:hypothetical protein
VLSGTALSNSVATSAGSRSFTMRNYRQELAIANGSTSYRVTADYTSDNSRLGSTPVSYRISTPTALVESSAGDFSAGSLRVDGRGSALLLTVTGTNGFRLQVDATEDGSFESNTTTTLAELRSLL